MDCLKALILEDDDLIAELLETVVAGLYPGVAVTVVPTLTEASQQVVKNRYDLLIADWNLPDGSGLDLVKKVRSSNRDMPVVMVSGRSDRDSVLQAAHYGIDGYITKPFDVQLLHERLSRLLKIESREPPALPELLENSLEQLIQLPSEIDPRDILELISRQDELSPAQLAERWREETSLTARLMDVANSSSFRRTGKPVETLRDAIASLGVALALNQALALSLDVSRKLQHELLRELAVTHHEMALLVAREAQRLAIRLQKPAVVFQQAGLLSRLGELAVLKVLNQFVAVGGSLGENEAEQALNQWSQRYGNRLKVQWRLPLGLRELIGSVHFIPGDCTREDRLIMRAAAMIAADEQATGECQKLLRRIGLETENQLQE
ncbi:response regulator [uncultured Marinobacter sp.]|uniref:response regulator n=1 Tax=uncultured Marinobacter sp. TaxID=187379 RepID=UPI00345A2389